VTEIRWSRFPLVAAHEHAHRWLQFTAHLGRAQNTVEAYGRALEDHLRFCGSVGADPLQLRADMIAAWIGGSADGKRYHEFGLYFLIALPASIPTTGEFDAFDPHYRLIMQWLPLKDLPPVVPIFLRTALLNPPDVPVLVVCDEIGLPNASGPCVR